MDAKEILATLNQLATEAQADAAAVADGRDAEIWRQKYLGRKGALATYSKKMAALPTETKPTVGKALNDLRTTLERLWAEIQEKTSRPTATIKIDPSLPGIRPAIGNLHPLTKTYYELMSFFTALGFVVAYGPEVEDDYHNFGALNFPADHPSRDAQDTFYLPGGWLLRTHTSPVQIRVMSTQRPPLRVIVPGRCFRADAVDASHFPVFHQLEGLLVDEEVSLADLKGTLEAFARFAFGPETKMRFVPHYFPFTEPSAEVHITCVVCGGRGCGTCGNKGWLEIAGAGMVHPNVFRNVGYDPDKWTGYAFGMGIERIAMLKYGINDIRLFYENDLRFLRQF